MNTVAKGDAFEEKAYNLIETAVQNGELGIFPSAAKVFRKKGYYSKDREDDIIFDLSIEVWLPNAPNYAFLWIIECKSYTGKIPVNDVEEFHAKIQQVAGVNVKGVFITDSTFQKGAFLYARSKKMMLIETQSEGYQIVLHKIDRTEATATNTDSFNEFESELAGRIHLFFSNLFVPNQEKVAGLQNLSAKGIEAIVHSLLKEFSPLVLEEYQSLKLMAFTKFLNTAYSLNIVTTSELGYDAGFSKILGSIDLETNTIYLDPSVIDSPRFAFVLAHEIGHFVLHRNLKSNQEAYDKFSDSTFNLTLGRYDLTNPKQWIEWQANVFASILLMPEDTMRVHLIMYQMQLGISRNRGRIYRDDQPVNRKDYKLTINYLASYFGVSKTSVRYRLQSLGVFMTSDASRWITQRGRRSFSPDSPLEDSPYNR